MRTSFSSPIARRGVRHGSGSGGVQRVWAWQRGNAVGLTLILDGGQFFQLCLCCFDSCNDVSAGGRGCSWRDGLSGRRRQRESNLYVRCVTLYSTPNPLQCLPMSQTSSKVPLSMGTWTPCPRLMHVFWSTHGPVGPHRQHCRGGGRCGFILLQIRCDTILSVYSAVRN